MPFTYWLPDENGQKKEYEASANAVIIIGANGAGKSKLGAWIEQQNYDLVHRIGAQRNLNFSENIALKRYAQAEDLVFYGSDESNGPYKLQKGSRWGWGGSRQFTTSLLNDFDNILAALLALRNNENEEFVRRCREAEQNGSEKPNTPITVVEKLKEIWRLILPQRQLVEEDSKLYAILRNNGTDTRYSATQMSDGERAVLYLSAQVLCVPQNKILIMDEPEIHLHRSIMNRLWKALEKSRPDCLFLYITHDTQFAAAHSHADIVWVKEYDGQNWKLERIENGDLPEELLLDILGSRKNVLFVEGERGSYDTQLYTELYPDYLVVPCGSCTQVIARTKAFRSSTALHDCEVYGLIDRDFRSDYEIEKYKEETIYTLRVAEVENLFIVEELIRLMAAHMGKNADEVFNEIKNYVITERYANQVNKQILQSVVAEIKYRLTCAEISKRGETEAKESLDSIYSGIEYDTIKSEHQAKFEAPIGSKNYFETIKMFNEKNIASSIGHFLSIENRDYCATVISLLQGEKHDEIVAAISPYLPPEIPR